MRPMVAPSPIPAAMIPRAVSSPYGVPTRALVFDKNKRPNFQTDLRQPSLAQGGQSMSMAYPNPNPNVMPGTTVSNAGPLRQ